MDAQQMQMRVRITSTKRRMRFQVRYVIRIQLVEVVSSCQTHNIRQTTTATDSVCSKCIFVYGLKLVTRTCEYSNCEFLIVNYTQHIYSLCLSFMETQKPVPEPRANWCVILDNDPSQERISDSRSVVDSTHITYHTYRVHSPWMHIMMWDVHPFSAASHVARKPGKS